MKKFLKRLQYNPTFSKVLTFFASPVHALARRTVNRVQASIKVNGGQVWYDGIALRFPKNVGVGFSSSIRWKGIDGFEPHTWRVIRNLGASCEIFVDVGSNFGFYSVLLGKINPRVRSFCFEPVPEIFKSNQQFHQANQSSHAEILNLAVSDQEGNDVLFLPAGQPVAEIRSGSLNKDFFYNQKFSQVEIPITKVTLDSFEQSRGSEWKEKRMLIKVDVEGHEVQALRGAAGVIQQYQPLIVCEIELIKENIAEIGKLLSQWNYTAYAISVAGLVRLSGDDMLAWGSGRDFLLVPSGRVDRNRTYFSFTELQGFNHA